jgi:hypothetical protein
MCSTHEVDVFYTVDIAYHLIQHFLHQPHGFEYEFAL